MDYLVNSDELTSIADAIRDRAALEGMPLVYPFDFAQEILNIPQEYDEDFIKALIERTFTQFSNSRIRSAGAYTFAGCSRLSIVDLPNLVSFAEHQFQSCIALREVTFPNVMYGAVAAFSDCYNLEYIEIPQYVQKYSYSPYSSMYYIPSSMFYRCSNLIDIEGIKYSEIGVIGQAAFSSCTLFTRINDFTHVKSIGGYAFYSCQNVSYLDFQELVSLGGYAFAYCSNISYANLPLLSRIDAGTFEFCGLTSISIPNVTYIGYDAFWSCKFSEVSAPLCSMISTYAFEYCYELETLYAPLLSKLSLNSMSIYTTGSYFYRCSKLRNLIVDPYLFYSIVPNGAFGYCSQLNFDNLIFDGCSHVGSYAFAGCLQLTEFYAPSCSTIFDGAFSGCLNLSSIILNNTAISSISQYTFASTIISIASYPNCTTVSYGAFQYCSSLTAISFPECSLIGGYAFAYCSNLQTVYLPKCTSISNYAFQRNSALSTIDLPLCSNIGSYAFIYCQNLTNISIPKCSIIYASAFAYCSNLMNLYAPLCKTISGSAFYQCSALSTVNLPLCSSISASAFAYCVNLTNVSIPQCTELISSAFYGCNAGLSLYAPNCKSITSYAIPSYMRSITLSTAYSIVIQNTFRYYSGSYLELPGVKAIYSSGFTYGSGLQTISLQQCSLLSRYAFYQCAGLQSVYLMYPGCVSIASWPDQIFYPSSICSRITFYVPASLVSSYKTHPYWAQVESQIVGV